MTVHCETDNGLNSLSLSFQFNVTSENASHHHQFILTLPQGRTADENLNSVGNDNREMKYLFFFISWMTFPLIDMDIRIIRIPIFKTAPSVSLDE